MIRVLVIHREPEEGVSWAFRLRSLGFDASAYMSLGASGFRAIRQDPPQVIVIDLTRLPSYGKAMGVQLREQKALRAIPLVFIEGDPEKAAQVRAILPDAGFTPWAKAAQAIRKAAEAPSRAVTPPRLPETPVVKKLGIAAGSKVAFCHSPFGFVLPDVSPIKRPEDADVVLIFQRGLVTLTRELPAIAEMMCPGRRVWVLWPKRTATMPSDLTMPKIREMALAVGLVDYKVCAVDATWSAMALGKRR